MTCPRQGRRSSALLATILLFLGCSADPPSPTARRLPAATLPSTSRDSTETASPVSRIVWAGALAPGQCGVLREDGGLTLLKPSKSGVSVSHFPGGGDAAASSLAIVGENRVVTGTASGLVLWDSSTSPPSIVSRLPCPAVSALLIVPDRSSDVTLLVGLVDGRIMRCQMSRDGRWHKPGNPTTSGARVRNLVAVPGTDHVMVVRQDGSSQKIRNDLVGHPIDEASCRDLVFGSTQEIVARQIDDYTITIGGTSSRRFPFALRYSSLAIADHGRTLITGYPGGILIAPLPPSGVISALNTINVAMFDGPVQVAVDPTDPQETRLAVGDGSGKIERVSLNELRERGIAASLDDVPDLAFRPWLRFARSRGNSTREVPPVSTLGKSLASLRSRIESGDIVQPLAELDDLLTRQNLRLEDRAEILALVAAIEARDGSASGPALRSIRAARDAFARSNRSDRAADMEFWEGLVRSRSFVPEDSSRGSQSSEAAVAGLLRSADLYRDRSPPSERQAQIASAAAAWALLDRGELARAQSVFQTVELAVGSDPVLARVREIDLIAAEIAMARGDYERAASISTKLLPVVAPSLDRRVRLLGAQAFAALERWPQAAELLQEDHPDDALWTLRRVICRAAADLPIDVEATDPTDPTQFHARALQHLQRGLTDSPDLPEDLTIAIEGHTRAGRRELAVESELALAETLAHRGRLTDARIHFETAAQAFKTLFATHQDGASGHRLLRGLHARAVRGWVNALVDGENPAPALHATLSRPSDSFASLGLSEEEFRDAEALSRMQGKLREMGGPGAALASDSLEINIRKLETALAGRRGRVLDDVAKKGGETTDLGLGANEAMIAFLDRGPDGLVGVLARAGSVPHIRVLPISRSDLDALVRDWRSRLADQGRAIPPTVEDRAVAIAGLGPEPALKPPLGASVSGGSHEAQIHDALFGPFQDQLAGVNRLFLVPSGSLAGVPIEIMGRDQRLLDRFEVTYLPQADLLAAMRDTRRAEASRSGSVLFLSPRDESQVRFWAVACREALWKPVALLNQSASRGRLQGLTLGSFEAVHLTAPIREVGPGEPFAIDLADGDFTCQDLAAMPIRSRVLVLQFSGSDGLTGEGIRDWARAGLLTGAQSVVVTLWEPPQRSARRFFSEFYKALKDGRSASRAVARAREAVAAIEEFRDPVHWAGYAVYEP